MEAIFPHNSIIPPDIRQAAAVAGETPFYLYDASLILSRCAEIQRMLPDTFAFRPRYAMKANSNKAILQLIAAQGFGMDASSINEVRRAIMAGIAPEQIQLTTQEVPSGKDRTDLHTWMRQGLRYNACSPRQLELVADFAGQHHLPLSIRIHPGHGGTGESLSRDTANPYASFGIHVTQLGDCLRLAQSHHLRITQVHQHIGSGGNPRLWQASIDRLLEIITHHLTLLPDLQGINLGGGLKEARMPEEEKADPASLGAYAAQKISRFTQQTGRTLAVEVEPGTYLVANAGMIVTRVIDLKSTGDDGYQFLVADGGMEMNARPLMYGARHPFALVSEAGHLRYSDYQQPSVLPEDLWIPVGRCCETGDAHSQDATGQLIPRRMATPVVGDLFLIGGCGAYTASMSPANYNSHTQAPAVLKMPEGTMRLIRKPQTLAQLTQNEIGLS